MNTALSVVESDYCPPIIIDKIRYHYSKAGIDLFSSVLPFVIIIFENGKETNKNLLIYDKRIKNLLEIEYELEDVVVNATGVPDFPELNITLPKVSLIKIQHSLLFLENYLRDIFNLPNLKFVYPGCSRTNNSHNGNCILKIGSVEKAPLIRFIIENYMHVLKLESDYVPAVTWDKTTKVKEDEHTNINVEKKSLSSSWANRVSAKKKGGADLYTVKPLDPLPETL